MPSATITRKGQVTIPKIIRQALNVGAGDRLDFVVETDGRVVVRPTLKGLLYRPGRRPVSRNAINAAIVRQGRR
jgi:antitoxin PrlF